MRRLRPQSWRQSSAAYPPAWWMTSGSTPWIDGHRAVGTSRATRRVISRATSGAIRTTAVTTGARADVEARRAARRTGHLTTTRLITSRLVTTRLHGLPCHRSYPHRLVAPPPPQTRPLRRSWRMRMLPCRLGARTTRGAATVSAGVARAHSHVTHSPTPATNATRAMHATKGVISAARRGAMPITMSASTRPTAAMGHPAVGHRAVDRAGVAAPMSAARTPQAAHARARQAGARSR